MNTMTISTKEIEDIKIGVYRNVKDKTKHCTITLKDFLYTIQNNNKELILKLRSIEDEKLQKEYKTNNIIGVTLSGVFGDSRTKENVLLYNNIMCIDVDEEDNKELFSQYNVDFIKEKIFELDFVYSVCLSCRGKGFYFIVPIPDSKDIDIYYTSMYYKLRKFGINIDKHCKDISRLRFCSYDDKMLVKKDCSITIFEEVSEEQIEEKRRELENIQKQTFSKRTVKYNDKYEYLKRTVNYLILKGFDTGEHWSEWATVGKYLKTFGDFGKELFHKISQNSSGYKGYNDVEKNWLRFKQCKSEDEGYGKFYTMVKNIYGDDWRTEMNNLNI